MPQGSRSFWLATLVILYVCFASLQSRGVGTARLLCVALTPLLLFELWRRTSDYDPKKQRQAQLHSRAIRALAWGSLLWLAARTGPPGRAALDAAANLGVGVACVAALICLARIPSSTGIMKAHPRTQSLDAAFFVSFLWGVAVALPAAHSAASAAPRTIRPRGHIAARAPASICAALPACWGGVAPPTTERPWRARIAPAISPASSAPTTSTSQQMGCRRNG